MASFTEQATLKVVDQSTAQINKINAALKKLLATANSLKSKSININVRATGIEKTLAGLKKLNAAAKKGTVVKQLSAAAVAPKQLTNFDEGKIFAFGWLKDGGLVTSRGVITSDVVLIKDAMK